MKEKVLTEITNFCKECSSHECCSEEDCILYRIEQLLSDKPVCESCWKLIEGYSFELEGTTMCSECYEYHGGFNDGKHNDI